MRSTQKENLSSPKLLHLKSTQLVSAALHGFLGTSLQVERLQSLHSRNNLRKLMHFPCTKRVMRLAATLTCDASILHNMFDRFFAMVLNGSLKKPIRRGVFTSLTLLYFQSVLETKQLCKQARVCNGMETSNIFSEKKEAWKPLCNFLSVSIVDLGCTRVKSSIDSFPASNTHCSRLCDWHCGNQYRRGHKDHPSHLRL